MGPYLQLVVRLRIHSNLLTPYPDTRIALILAFTLTTSYIHTILTHCGPVTQICVFTLQLCKTDEANLRF